jgi:hypothetical protein
MRLRKERKGKTQTVMIVKHTNKNTAEVDDRQPPAAMIFKLTSTQVNCVELASVAISRKCLLGAWMQT